MCKRGRKQRYQCRGSGGQQDLVQKKDSRLLYAVGVLDVRDIYPNESISSELSLPFESIRPGLINLGRPKFEFDSTQLKYGV